MKSIYELITDMKGKVPMYVGSNSIFLVAAFLRGYEEALIQQGTDSEMRGFQHYVAKAFDVKTSQSWDRIIQFHSACDDSALHTFFRLADEYFKSAPGATASLPSRADG